MKLPIVLSTLFNILNTSSPNLCDDVYLDSAGSPYMDSIGQTVARYCQWVGPDAPVWDADVCCTIGSSGASCTRPASNGRCRVGLKMYCEFGETTATGSVVCMQPFPDACEEGFCIQAPSAPPPVQAFGACCSEGGACQPVSVEETLDCPDGLFVTCGHGFQNEDGTVECYS